MPENHPILAHRIQYIRDLAARSLDELREVIWDLRPTILDDLGLIPAIHWYARTYLEKNGIKTEIVAPTDLPRLPAYLETMLFRITQEALTNIKKHAQADSVMIILKIGTDQIFLDIKDNGRGFDVNQITQEAVAHQQLGLLGIQERISLVGGKLQIESTPGTGTHLHVYIPIMDEYSVKYSTHIEKKKGKTAEVQ